MSLTKFRIKREPPEEPPDTCFNCGGNMRPRPENLSWSLVQTLLAYARKDRGRGHYHHRTTIDMNHSGYANLAKLVWWGLLTPQWHTDRTGKRVRVVGMFKVTDLGYRFAHLEARVPRRLYVFRKHVVSQGEELIYANQAAPETMTAVDFIAQSLPGVPNPKDFL